MAAIRYIAVTACFLFSPWSIVSASSDICYFPDGSPIASTTYTPCFPTANNTHCCDENDTCLSNGLCLVKWDTSFNTGGCTDSTWNSVECFPQCVSSQLDDVSTLYRCNNNNWCCSDHGNTTSCCNDPQVKLFNMTGVALVQNGTAFLEGYNIAPDVDIVTTTTLSSSTVLSSSSPTRVSTTNVTSQCTSTASTSSSTNVTTIGLGVGLGIGVPLLAAIGFLSFLLFREKKNNRKLGGQNKGGDEKSKMTANPLVPSHAATHSHQTGFAEADSRQKPQSHEMYGNYPAHVQIPHISEMSGQE